MSTIALRDYLWLPPLPAWLTREAVAFAVRNWLASMLALYIAFALQLESPVWALLTVWLVAGASPGLVLSKGVYRILGSIGGATAGVILIALFSQTPPLFVLALALFVGACTVASNILTNFRAYATVLAGYTAGIVASGAINAPDQVFFIATARAAEVVLGVACSIVVHSIFAPHRAEAEARHKLAELLRAAARRAAIPWQVSEEDRLQVGKKLIADTIAADTLIEYAAAESGLFRLQEDTARSLLAHLLGLISARRSLDAHLRRHGWPANDALQIYHGIVLDLLAEMPAQLEAGKLDEQREVVAQVHARLDELRPEDDAGLAADVISARLVIDRIEDMLGHLGRALDRYCDILEERRRYRSRRVLNFHRDQRAAWINGLRAFTAVSLVGAFWIGSAWPHGPNALIFASVILSLFSAAPRPDVVGWSFFKASLPAVVVGLVMKFYLLPANSGFDYLFVATSIVLLPLGLVMANPATTGLAFAFAFIFLNTIGPANPMVYDLTDTLNTALANIMGVLAGTLAYIYILPPNPHAARVYVTYRIRAGLAMLAARTPIVPFFEWETRMYDRVNRLHDPLNPSGVNTNEWLEAGLGALTLGNEILRLRLWLAEDSMPSAVRAEIEPVIDGLTKILSQPEEADRPLPRARARVLTVDPGRGHPQRITWARVAGALEEIDVYLAAHPRLLNRAPVP